MYLEKKLQNKYTIGKYLRNQKRLRKRDPIAKPIPLPAELREYKQDLEKRGLQVGALDFGLFETKNGLKYSGFIASEDIPTNSILLRVPVDCLLTTRDAFLSQIQRVFEQNPKFYAKAFSSDWQDRMLLTYLLFEYQKGKNSSWYHLIRNLPKEIDYVILWEDQQLDKLEDEWIKKSILTERQKVLKQQCQLIQIAKKYPQFFDMNVFTPQNISWIHIHLVTRCFGKYFQYTTMVPYAELFNHECTDVYYTMTYNQGNPHDTHEVLDPPRTITEEEAEEVQTSEGSYQASDVSADDSQYKANETDILDEQDYQPKVQSEIKSINSYITTFISFNDGVSLPFLGKTYQQMENIRTKEQDKQIATKRLEKVHLNNVKYLKLIKQFYNKLEYKTYTYTLRQKKKWKEQKQSKQELEVDPKQNYFEGAWKKDKFDDFLMVCSSKDQYQAGSQVYFCYGRLPNRLLLMRYGISLEHNKYNHLFIRIDISDFVYENKPLLKCVFLDINLKKYRKFKVKRSVFCCQLLTFYRCSLWEYNEDPENIFYVVNLERQLKVIAKVEDIFSQMLKGFKFDLKENQERLLDKNVGYHQYFATIYKLQQQRLLNQQMCMLDYAKTIVNKLLKGQIIEDILKGETQQKYIRYQLMMKVYFKYLKCNF